MFKFKLDRNLMLIGIAAIGIVVTGALILMSSNPNFLKFGGGLSSAQAAQKSIDYINKNMLTGKTASLVSVAEESSMFKIKIKIDSSEYDTYITKDGKLLFTNAIKLNPEDSTNTANNADNASDTAAQPKKTCEDVKKQDSPTMDAYIVSACPFGLQMQRVLADIAQNVPSLSKNINVKYFGSISNGKVISMHGDAEATENLRQVCVREEDASKYWKYVSCYIKAGDSAGCLTSIGVDKTKISDCMASASRGLAYIQKDFDAANANSIQGSPTLIVNGGEVSEYDFGGRNSQAVKDLLCCGFNAKPDACSAELNATDAAASFSETYVGSGGGGSGNSGANGVNCAPAQ